MSNFDDRNRLDEDGQDHGEGDDIARLLRASGARREPSLQMRARLHAAALETFEALPAERRLEGSAARQTAQQVTRGNDAYGRSVYGRNVHERVRAKPQGSRLLGPRMALAATLLVAIGAALFWQTRTRSVNESTVAEVAQVQFARGGWTVNGQAGDARALLQAHAKVRTTSDGKLELRLVGGALLRLAGDSELVLTAVDRINLQAGRVYVDANAPTSAMHVVTAQGTVTDLGTQFEVQLSPSAVTVLVREGRVMLASDHAHLTAGATNGVGESLSVRTNGNVLRHSLLASDPYWQWLADARAPYELERGTLHDFLVWSAAEAGLMLRYQSEEVRRAAVATRTRGNIVGMSMQTAIENVLATTRLRRKPATDHELVIEFADRD